MMDIRGADLPLLMSLDILLEEKNVTRAASRLHLSQPALSTQLGRLRDLFGDALLIPAEAGRGMVATPRALELQGPLHAALQQLGLAVRGQAPPFDPASARRTFAIAGNDNAVIMLMLDVVRHVDSVGGSGLKLAFHSPQPEQIVGQMERGEIDLLIGAGRYAPPALSTHAVMRMDHRMAQRKGHPRGSGPLDLDAYCALRHIMVSAKAHFHGFIDELLEQQGRSRNVAISVAQYNLVPPILAATDFVCTLPSRFLERFDDQLDTFDLPLATRNLDLSMSWHPRAEHDAGLAWLRQQILAGVPQ